MWPILSQQVPEPVPTPVEPAPPTPIQIEQLFNLPPEVIEKLTPPDPSGLTQPVATLLAAGIALVAACIAWWGVDRQIKANHANTNRQLATQRHLHREVQKSELRKRAREERLNALQEAVVALIELRTASKAVIVRLTRSYPGEYRESLSKLDGSISKSNQAQAKLVLLRMDKAKEVYLKETTRIKEIREEAIYDRIDRDENLTMDDANRYGLKLNEGVMAVYRLLSDDIEEDGPNREMLVAELGGLEVSEPVDVPAPGHLGAAAPCSKSTGDNFDHQD